MSRHMKVFDPDAILRDVIVLGEDAIAAAMIETRSPSADDALAEFVHAVDEATSKLKTMLNGGWQERDEESERGAREYSRELAMELRR